MGKGKLRNEASFLLKKTKLGALSLLLDLFAELFQLLLLCFVLLLPNGRKRNNYKWKAWIERERKREEGGYGAMIPLQTGIGREKERERDWATSLWWIEKRCWLVRILSCILHRFYKNRCRNAFSKMDLSKSSLKLFNYLQKYHRFTYDIGFHITDVKPAS